MLCSSTFQLWSVCFEIFFLNITHSSSYLHIHLSISANYGKQVFSNMHTDRKLSRNYTCYPDASVLCSLYSKGLWKANVIVMDNSMEVTVLDKYSMPFNDLNVWNTGLNNSSKLRSIQNASLCIQTNSAILWEYTRQENDIEAAIILRAERLHNSIRT